MPRNARSEPLALLLVAMFACAAAAVDAAAVGGTSEPFTVPNRSRPSLPVFLGAVVSDASTGTGSIPAFSVKADLLVHVDPSMNPGDAMHALLPVLPLVSARDVDSACRFEPWNCQRLVQEPDTLVLVAIAAAVAANVRRWR